MDKQSFFKKTLRLLFIVLCAVLLARFLEIAYLQFQVFRVSDDEIRTRAHVGSLYRLADHYRSVGGFGMAATYYETALRVDARNMPYQLKYAQTLAADGRGARALERAEAVRDAAEDPGVRAEASKLVAGLRKKNVRFVEVKEPAGIAADVKIAIVPIGGTKKEFLEALVPRLESIMKCTFVIGDRVLELGKPDRDRGAMFLGIATQHVAGKLSMEKNVKVLAAGGIEGADLKTQEGKERFVRVGLEDREVFPELARSDFDSQLVRARAADQYDVDRLLDELIRFEGLPEETGVVGYVGVVDRDIYSGGYDHLFASSSGPFAVFSTARFGLTGGPAERERTFGRAFKQAVTSAFFALQIPRCSSFYCIRAYPNSVADFDAKKDSVCLDCRRRLYQSIAARTSAR